MESSRSLLNLFLFITVVPCIAFSSYISNEVLEPPHRSIGRFLLQQKSPCRVDIQNMNYTVITSRCKGPNYMSQMCCPPLKELVCPIQDDFNDLSTNCADTFFSYVNLYGKYPPGLFGALCKEDDDGLHCEDIVSPPPSHQNPDPPAAAAAAGGGAAATATVAYNSTLLMILVGLLTLLIFYV